MLLMKKKLLKSALVLLVIFAVLVCVLPWPTRIDLTMPGGRINAEGEIIQEGTTHLEGWQYHYLFREDMMKVSVEVMDLTLSNTDWQKHFYSCRLGDFRHMVQSIYVNEWNEFEISEISIANDDSWFLVRIGPRMYFGSVNPQMDAAAILAECRAVID